MSGEDRARVGLTEGTVVDGRYLIESELGRGGFARVYRASHTELGRGVALKVIDLPQQPGAVDPFIQRFRREAQIAANLVHPNVVTVFDYGVVDQTGQPYLAMQLLDGIDLEMVLAHHGRFDPARAIRLMIGVLDALADAQSQGIVHKDLKPSNLFLIHRDTDREQLILIDFGIARIWDDDDSRVTQTGGFTGTPAYFAPEYVENQIVTPAIDVYQCGLILVEMITGFPAVIAENSMQYLFKHCAGEIDVPPELDDSPLGPVLRKALAVDHLQRYPDCAAFREALQAVDAEQIPSPHRRTGGPTVRHDTLENPPETGDFPEEIGSAETLVAPRSGEVEPKLETRRPASPRAAAAGVIVVLLIVGGGLLLAVKRSNRAERPLPPAGVERVSTTPPPPARAQVVPEERAVDAGESAPDTALAAVLPARIQSTPAGALVEIDGIGYGPTPLKVAGPLLSGDSHTVRLRHKGYQPFTAEMVFEAGRTQQIELVQSQKKTTPRKKKRRRRKAISEALAN